MTDPTAPPHPDDERLSAVLDGEGRPDDAAHAGSCPICATRLSQLRSVAAAVGAPVGAADPQRRAAAVAAALATAGPAQAREDEQARVVSISRARRPIPLPRWLAAAAVLLLLALAIPAAVRFAGEGGDDDSATSATTTMAAGDDSASAEAAPPAELRTTRDAGDLGDIDADTNLPERLDLASAQSADEAGGATTTEAAGATTTAPTTAAGAAVPCEDAVRTDDPGLGSLLATAEASFDGDPVAVLAFEAGGEVRVYAVAVDSCELRTVQTAR